MSQCECFLPYVACSRMSWSAFVSGTPFFIRKILETTESFSQHEQNLVETSASHVPLWGGIAKIWLRG